jgi:hypothetical protein
VTGVRGGAPRTLVAPRTVAAAARADRLGLPEYCAMEAYRVEVGAGQGPPAAP